MAIERLSGRMRQRSVENSRFEAHIRPAALALCAALA
jgi:hypothetical protein